MPLPNNGPLCLQGHSSAVHSKPKQAMVVRMSAETLDALASFSDQPQIDFEFGENPGIHIGDAFFPMQSFKESAPHEIYLRAFTEAKPLAPLKLYANVSRKFLVGRELDDKVKDKIRDRTLEAAKQRTERKAIFLEAPPTAASGSSKKRKTQPATTASKKLHERFPSASSAPSPSPSPSPTRSPSKDADPTGPRVRMIRCLVSQPRFEEEVVRLVGGPNCAIARKEELSQLLREVAEQVGPIKKGMDKANGTWRLKTKTWLEVRPYEWSILSDSERAAMIRQARVAFDEMKIPKSDPVWHNIELRSAKNGIAASANANGSSSRGTSLNPGSSRGNSSNSGTSQLAETSKVEQARRAGPSADAKVKKAKAKAVPMPAKDESLKLPHAGSAAPADKNDRSIAPIDTDLRQESTARRPGSGYKSKPSPTTTAAGVHATSPNQGAGSTGGQSASKQRLSPVPPKSSAAMTPSSRSSSSVTDSRNQPPVKKNKAEPAELTERERSWEGRIPKKRPDEMASSSERDSKRGKERIRQPSTINGPSHGADAHDARPSDRDKRIPKTSNNGGIDSDRERERKKEPNTDRANNKGVQRLQERDRESAGRSPALGHFKRKVLGKDDDDFSESYTRKKLKPHEPETRSRSPPSKISAPDLSLPKRPDAQSPSTLPKQKFRKEPSPRPSPSGPSSSTSLSQSRPKDDSGKRHGTSKRRRRSPIYTSSEDESLASKPQPANVSNAISTPAQNMPPRPSLSASEPRSSVASDQSPTKLRLRYHKVYSEYLQTYQALVEEMRKNEELLARWSETEGSDEDVELLESEELRRLRSKYASLHAELVEIREICEGAGS